jgi:hypothetical protein
MKYGYGVLCREVHLLQLIEMLQSCQNYLFTGFFDFTGEEDFIEYGVNL